MLAFLFCLGAYAPAKAAEPVVGGPWTVLRKAPLFDAETIPLASTWGPTLPLGSEFHVEKVYGRWLFGTPEPLAKMKAKDYAPAGWVFSRMLLVPGDADTVTPAVARKSYALLYHARAAWKKMQPGDRTLTSPLDFY